MSNFIVGFFEIGLVLPVNRFSIVNANRRFHATLGVIGGNQITGDKAKTQKFATELNHHCQFRIIKIPT